MSGRWHPAECKICGARAPKVSISATGLCRDHSQLRMERNIRSLREKRGEDFDNWARGIARGVVRTVQLARASSHPQFEEAP